MWDSLPVGNAVICADRSTKLERQITEIFLKLRDPVYRYVVRIVGSADEAEDLVQEAFYRLFDDLRRGCHVQDARFWVFRVAHNLAIDHCRHRRFSGTAVRQDGAGTYEREDPGPSAEQDLLERERIDRLEAALTRLSPQEHQCLQLRSQGLRYREIGELLGIRIPTVQTLLGRAIRKLVSETQ
jgi:RNA polymerase sigma-70 factor (ECF subfamily)